jgi:hypothetical protein
MVTFGASDPPQPIAKEKMAIMIAVRIAGRVAGKPLAVS